MDHDLELFIPILKLKSATFSIILEILENGFFQFSPILEIVDRTIHTQSYPGNSGSYDPYISPILEILDRTIHIQSYPGNIGSYDPYSVLSWK